MRLVLFDIDGTLLSSGPMARRVFSEALKSVFGTEGRTQSYPFEGKLDPIIVTELMREAGLHDSVIERHKGTALSLYLDRLGEALAAERPTLKPGIRPLVESVASSPGAIVALLTGNLERGARIKLTAAGLWHHFRFGVWGDDAACRVDLGPVALERAHQVTGLRVEPADCVIVGDALADVECGRALGARVVAVATGRTPEDALRSAGADRVFSDFSNLEEAQRAILA